jgi:hypothetical protein
MESRAALIFGTLFSLVVGAALFSLRSKGRQRTADLLRSVEVEIDDEMIAYRSRLGKKIIRRSNILEAGFSEKGVWLRGEPHSVRLQLPRELEDFHELQSFLQNWLPDHTVRRNSSPSTAWTYIRVYGAWIAAALLLYVAMTSKTPMIAVPGCLLSAIGITWYFTWCGRKINERKWKIMLPISGYLVAVALLGRAVIIWTVR